MSRNLLENGEFEANWGEKKSHRCLIFPKDSAPYEKDVGNIFTPPGWITWFHHDPGQWDQPEVRDAWKQHDPRRVHSGQKAILLFTFFRRHDAGFLQQVPIAPGTPLKLAAWAHAWSNHSDQNNLAKFPHPDDPMWSEGVGYGAGFALEGETQDDNWRNFTFYVGIDPTGGTNPLASTVVWGTGAHIYNEYAQVPSVETTAQGDTVTVFVRSKTLWPFKHNDAYWDDALLTAVGQADEKPEVRLNFWPSEPKIGEVIQVEARSLAPLSDVQIVVTQPSGAKLTLGSLTTGRDDQWHTWTMKSASLNERGLHEIVFQASGDVRVTSGFESVQAQVEGRGDPREQYQRTYVLLPPGANSAWALAVVDSTWDQERYTIGSSADDAGIGDLNVRRVIAVNPENWPTDLKAFFDEHYPGVEYQAVKADNPQELRNKLRRL
ncbi:MAG TPA: hypothetical protein ENN19_13780 [Chloroflexi bacterium]|nr:hypothetical protein [Chloroflexota bacterium]